MSIPFGELEGAEQREVSKTGELKPCQIHPRREGITAACNHKCTYIKTRWSHFIAQKHKVLLGVTLSRLWWLLP